MQQRLFNGITSLNKSRKEFKFNSSKDKPELARSVLRRSSELAASTDERLHVNCRMLHCLVTSLNALLCRTHITQILTIKPNSTDQVFN